MKTNRRFLPFFLLAVLLILFHRYRQPVLQQVRRFNKAYLNCLTMQIAGRSGSPFAVVEHVGRSSGKSYETPIIVRPVSGGFVFALTYGPEVDWYKNILAAGTCRLRYNDRYYNLHNPQTISTAAGIAAFPLPLQLVLRLLDERDFFNMQIA